MIYVRDSVRVEAPPAIVWAWLSDLERVMKVNAFHVGMRFATERRRGKGTLAIVDHSFFGSPIQRREARVTHWEEGKGLGWVETDPRAPKHIFPHSSQYRLEPLPDGATLVTDELRGSLNAPFAGDMLDTLMQDQWIVRVMRDECKTLKAHVEEFAAGFRAASRSAGALDSSEGLAHSRGQGEKAAVNHHP